MDIEEQMQLHKEIEELDERRRAAAKDGDYKTAHERGMKIQGRYETLVSRLEDEA